MIKIPKLTDVSSTLAGQQQRRAELLGEAQDLRRQLLELARSPEPDAQPRDDAGVAELLGRVPPPRRASRVEQLAAMRLRITTLEAAAAVLAREIEVEINRASLIIRERTADEFRTRLRAIALALIEAAKANAALTELTDAREAQEVRGASGMTSVSPQLLGHPRDPHATVHMWLREAVAEALARSDLPLERKKVGITRPFSSPPLPPGHPRSTW